MFQRRQLILQIYRFWLLSISPAFQAMQPPSWKALKGSRFIATSTCELIDDPEFKPILDAAEIAVQNTTSLLSLVAEGVGITTLPKLAVPSGAQNIIFLPINKLNLKRTTGLITPAGRTLITH